MTTTATEFPPVLEMGGHQYRLVAHHRPVQFNAQAFAERVQAIVADGCFLPVALFTWSAYQPGEPTIGRFNYDDFQSIPPDAPERLSRQGGALYARQDQEQVAAAWIDAEWILQETGPIRGQERPPQGLVFDVTILIGERGRFVLKRGATPDRVKALGDLRAWAPTVTPDLVFCHGDFCLPNALVQDGEISGVVDWSLGGYADRRHDLAMAVWSTRYNRKEERYVDAFLRGYGYEGDRTELAPFKLLEKLV